MLVQNVVKVLKCICAAFSMPSLRIGFRISALCCCTGSLLVGVAAER